MKKQFNNLIRMLAIVWAVVLWQGHAHAGDPGVFSEPGEGKGCCAYALQFVNLYEEKYISKIRVSAICDTKICCADPDAWAQGGNIPEYVEWFPADSSAIPFGNAIDNEFLIYLDSETAPHTLQVEWFDLNGNIVCRHLIEIACEGHYKEDEDWTQYTSITSLDDKKLFVFAVREPEEDEEGCDQDDLKKSECTFSSNITCFGIDEYTVGLFGPGEFTSFTWQVISGPTTPGLNPVQNPVMNLTQSGVYVVSLLAINSNTLDTCESIGEVIIPAFNPSASINYIPCGFQAQITGAHGGDAATVSSILWQCLEKPDFPSSGTTVTYDFGAEGTYHLIMTVMDIYGCAHSIPVNVVISTECVAKVKVKEYVLCPGCVGERDIQVTFENLSTGGICPIQYEWNFGDGSPVQVTNQTQQFVQHVYEDVNCKDGEIFQLVLKMIDSSTPTPCTSLVTIPVFIEPCNVVLTVITCPDGKVIFESNKPGEWTLPAGSVEAPGIYSGEPDENGYQTSVVVKLPAGSHTVTVKGHCTTGGTCTVSKTFDVVLECCAKNDAHRPDPIPFTEGGKDYRMKHNMVQRQLPLIHHIKVKTKLKVKKSLLGIGYWKGTKADEIEASHTGTIYKSDVNCNCKTPQAVSGSEIKYNKTKAKYRQHINGRFRSKTNSLESTHRVVKGGSTVVGHCHLGIDCDEFRWWTDWY